MSRRRIGRAVTALTVSALAVVPGTAGATAATSAATQDDGATAGDAGTAAVASPSAKRGSWVAKVLVQTGVRTKPGRNAGRWIWTARTSTEHTAQAQELMVLGSRRLPNGQQWLRVQLPIRPNATTGWVPAAAVRLRQTAWFIRVSLAKRELTVLFRGRPVRTVSVVVGAPSTPTPQGLFAVHEVAKQRDPEGFIGPWALHLTALSDVLTDYGGGPGRVALHGRSGVSLRDPLGAARSHGCVRLANHDVRWLAQRLRGGTPVQIRR